MANLIGNSGLRATVNQLWSDRRSNAAAIDSTTATTVHLQGQSQPFIVDADLMRMLEDLVIPNLVTSSPKGGIPVATIQPLPTSRGAARISESEMIAFAELSVTADAHEMLTFVEAQLSHGHSVETLYLQLLAPAARKLGEYWEDDREDFVTVTMALWRIQEVLRELSLKVPPRMPEGAFDRRALFSNLPGEQHSFGMLMVADCFERSCWQTDILIDPERRELTGKVASQHYDLIGLTISCDCPSARLAELVTTIRTVSRNPGVKVLIGGGAVIRHPELVSACGADGTASDASGAIELADRLVPVSISLAHA